MFFAVHGPMLDHSEDPRSPSTSGCLAAIYSGRRLKLRVSYTRLTWGLANRCAEILQLLGSAHIALARSGPNLPTKDSTATHGPGSHLIVSHLTDLRRGAKIVAPRMHRISAAFVTST